MITVVDYGLGNIGAFLNVYKRMNIPAKVARTAGELEGAERIILPGVGTFDRAMDLLDESGMRGTLDELVIGQRRPVIGICVGMQILAGRSDEGVRDGLGWIAGKVRSFQSHPAAGALPLPHMGWNDVELEREDGLFGQLEKDGRFYFLHSFYFECADPADRIATTRYGAPFACAVRRGNISGVQFHPEKSHHFGATLLKNFATL